MSKIRRRLLMQQLNPKEDDHLYIEAFDGDIQLYLSSKSSYQTIWYSRNRIDWSQLTTSTTVPIANGERLYLRGLLTNNNSEYYNMTTLMMSSNNEGKASAGGNINYLFNYNDLTAPYKECCGLYLFYGNPIIKDVSKLVFPDVPQTYRSFYRCFQGSGIVNLPKVESTTLARQCYTGMFQNCKSLTTADGFELPAIRLADQCYEGMFNSCVNLTTPPSKLPATTLAKKCYSTMFESCSKLTTSPILPADTLGVGSYRKMFYNNTSNTHIICLARNISATNCLENWLYNISKTGTLYCEQGMINTWRNTGTIPSGWNIMEYQQ